jgi:hypothetical protein
MDWVGNESCAKAVPRLVIGGLAGRSVRWGWFLRADAACGAVSAVSGGGLGMLVLGVVSAWR